MNNKDKKNQGSEIQPETLKQFKTEYSKLRSKWKKLDKHSLFLKEQEFLRVYLNQLKDWKPYPPVWFFQITGEFLEKHLSNESKKWFIEYTIDKNTDWLIWTIGGKNRNNWRNIFKGDLLSSNPRPKDRISIQSFRKHAIEEQNIEEVGLLASLGFDNLSVDSDNYLFFKTLAKTNIDKLNRLLDLSVRLSIRWKNIHTLVDNKVNGFSDSDSGFGILYLLAKYNPESFAEIAPKIVKQIPDRYPVYLDEKDYTTSIYQLVPWIEIFNKDLVNKNLEKERFDNFIDFVDGFVSTADKIARLNKMKLVKHKQESGEKYSYSNRSSGDSPLESIVGEMFDSFQDRADEKLESLIGVITCIFLHHKDRYAYPQFFTGEKKRWSTANPDVAVIMRRFRKKMLESGLVRMNTGLFTQKSIVEKAFSEFIASSPGEENTRRIEKYSLKEYMTRAISVSAGMEWDVKTEKRADFKYSLALKTIAGFKELSIRDKKTNEILYGSLPEQKISRLFFTDLEPSFIKKIFKKTSFLFLKEKKPLNFFNIKEIDGIPEWETSTLYRPVEQSVITQRKDIHKECIEEIFPTVLKKYCGKRYSLLKDSLPELKNALEKRDVSYLSFTGLIERIESAVQFFKDEKLSQFFIKDILEYEKLKPFLTIELDSEQEKNNDSFVEKECIQIIT